MNENMTKAAQCAAQLLADLRETMKTANRAEGIIILRMIRDVAPVLHELEYLSKEDTP